MKEHLASPADRGETTSSSGAPGREHRSPDWRPNSGPESYRTHWVPPVPVDARARRGNPLFLGGIIGIVVGIAVMLVHFKPDLGSLNAHTIKWTVQDWFRGIGRSSDLAPVQAAPPEPAPKKKPAAKPRAKAKAVQVPAPLVEEPNPSKVGDTLSGVPDTPAPTPAPVPEAVTPLPAELPAAAASPAPGVIELQPFGDNSPRN